MQPAIVSDREAEQRMQNYNKVHLALTSGAKTTHQLALDTGLAANEVSAAIHYLSRQRMVESMWSDLHSTKTHALTEVGRTFVPLPPAPPAPSTPPPVPDFKSPACDPRVPPKHAARFTGTRHFEGISGKFPVDQEGNVILDPTKTKGQVYFAIDRAMTSAEIIQKTGLPDQVVWNHLSELTKMQLVIYETAHRARIYRHNPDLKAIPSDAYAPPPAPLASVKPAPAPAPPPDARKVEVVSTQPVDLGPAIQLLLRTYHAADIALALFSEVDKELSELRDFKTRTESLFSNVKLAEKK